MAKENPRFGTAITLIAVGLLGGVALEVLGVRGGWFLGVLAAAGFGGAALIAENNSNNSTTGRK